MARDRKKLKDILRKMKDDEPEPEKADHGFAFVESMTRIPMSVSGAVIRVWREESDLGPYQLANMDLREVAYKMGNQGTFLRVIAVELAKMPRVTAVEWLDENGDGGVIYGEWP
jgi:hypothetical protein